MPVADAGPALRNGQAVALLAAFNPLASMHAALDRAGAGMPCGLAVRITHRTVEEVELAIAQVKAQLPVLGCALQWRGSVPELAPLSSPASARVASSDVSLTFATAPDAPLWRYALLPDRSDVWLKAVWSHAAADGRSMLEFTRRLGAALQREAAPPPRPPGRLDGPRRMRLAWLLRFLVERHLPYRPAPIGSKAAGPGVSWTTLDPDRADQILQAAHEGCGGVAAWLSSAACLAFADAVPQSRRRRIALNLPIARGGLQAFSDFGFRVGSLLAPVTLRPGDRIEAVAARIATRQRAMLAEHYDEQLQAFLGDDPRRHLQFAKMQARAKPAPTLNVSWKGRYCEIGGAGPLRDLACFASSPGVHVSAHVDANGLSLSVTSHQSAPARAQLLRSIVAHLDGGGVDPIRTLEDLDLPRAPWDAQPEQKIAVAA